MSSRQIRKLRQQQELLQASTQAEQRSGDVEESSEEEVAPVKPRASMFAGLVELEKEEKSEDEDAELGDSHLAEAEAEAAPQAHEAPSLSNTSKKKPKKKKGKGKAQQKGQRAARPGSSGGTELDEIDQALQDLAVSHKAQGYDDGQSQWGVPEQSAERLAQLLRINFHQLKVINEMRKLFGREVIDSVNVEEGGPVQRQGAALMENVDLESFLKGRPGESLPEVILRKNPFIDGKPTWPKSAAGGLSMKQISESGESRMEFAFSHDKQYQDLEAEFFQYAVGLDAMPMIQFLHTHPYHVSSLIQVSKIAKQDQNAALSSDLCERALFTMGRVTLSAFRKKLEEGKARLDFDRPENRQFFLAAWHYIRTLVIKGTHKTALEWAKLILSVDRSDPYAILHVIHPVAIKAWEARWLIDLCDTDMLEQYSISEAIYVRQTVTLAWLQLRDTDRAKSHLSHMMQRLPSLYCLLFSTLNLDTPKSLWATQARNPDEELFNQLYVHTTKDLWNTSDALTLLKKVAHEIEKPQLSSLPEPPVPQLRVARFIISDNTPSLLAHLPKDFSKAEPNYEFDPLPPAEEDNIFSYEGQRRAWTYRSGPDGFAGLLQLRQADLEGIAGGPEALAELLRDIETGHDEGFSGDDGEDDREDDGEDDEDADAAGQGQGRRAGAVPDILLRVLDSLYPWRARRGAEASNNPGQEVVDSEDEEMPALERSDGS